MRASVQSSPRPKAVVPATLLGESSIWSTTVMDWTRWDGGAAGDRDDLEVRLRAVDTPVPEPTRLFLEYTVGAEAPCFGLTGLPRATPPADRHDVEDNPIVDASVSADVFAAVTRWRGLGSKVSEQVPTPSARWAEASGFAIGPPDRNPFNRRIFDAFEHAYGKTLAYDPVSRSLRFGEASFGPVREAGALVRDHALVLRLRNPFDPDTRVVTFFGCTGHGTRAVGRAFSRPDAAAAIFGEINARFAAVPFLAVVAAEVDPESGCGLGLRLVAATRLLRPVGL